MAFKILRHFVFSQKHSLAVIWNKCNTQKNVRVKKRSTLLENICLLLTEMCFTQKALKQDAMVRYVSLVRNLYLSDIVILSLQSRLKEHAFILFYVLEPNMLDLNIFSQWTMIFWIIGVKLLCTVFYVHLVFWESSIACFLVQCEIMYSSSAT